MNKIRSLAGCLKPSVYLDIRTDEAFRGKPYETVLFGPVGALLEEEKINPEWEVGNVITPASGEFGTVVVYIRQALPFEEGDDPTQGDEVRTPWGGCVD